MQTSPAPNRRPSNLSSAVSIRDSSSFPLLKSAQFKRALAQRLAVAVNADGQHERRFVLLLDDLRQRVVMRLAQLLVISDDGLKLFHQPVNHRAAQQQQQAESSEKQPAIIHAGGM